MKFNRACGILVHPTSFPNEYGIGDFGPSARRFIDFLVDTHQTVWQILPLGPTGYGNSPYASFSAFAGNHYLISPEILAEKGLVSQLELHRAKVGLSVEVAYDDAFKAKDILLKLASASFYKNATHEDKQKLDVFKKENAYWLDDYALFMACSLFHNKTPWNKWPKEIRKRTKAGLTKWKKDLAKEINYQYWLQFEFFEQWFALKSYTNNKGVKIIGDIPIFVDHNSADVWAHSDFFAVDEDGNRELVSGVPPDYFSETGQLWGNPLYKWNVLEEHNYEWWIKRFEQMFTLYDAIRVDHFRGFDAYWEIKADEETAINGRWVKGPGIKLFNAIKEALGELPIIAEDLGVLTPSVVVLRDSFSFPGMKILQFAFSDNAANGFLPHNYQTSNCVVYSGTHDNDTTLGWYNQGTDLEKHRVREYTQSDGRRINWELIRLGMFSVADLVIIPLQDFMNLGSEHRMNYPGTSTGNWKWRFTPAMLKDVDKEKIRFMANVTNRNPLVRQNDANLMEIETDES